MMTALAIYLVVGFLMWLDGYSDALLWPFVIVGVLVIVAKDLLCALSAGAVYLVRASVGVKVEGDSHA